MSSNLMDTEPGGESTQYESIKTVTEPHAKQGGQLSGESTDPADKPHKSATDTPNSAGVTPAEKIRYGQAIQEGGVGGKTDPSSISGEASTEGGFGGTEALNESDEALKRREQGYGGNRDMDRNIGA